MDTDLQEFLKHHPYFFDDLKKINIVGIHTFSPNEEFSFVFPSLSKLLEKVRITKFSYEGIFYHLYTWTTSENDTCGWLCSAPFESDFPFLHEHHNLILQQLGFILTTWNNRTRLSSYSLQRLLSPYDANVGIGSWQSFFYQLCLEEKKAIDIDFDDYVTFSVVNNETFFLYHNETSEVLIFSTEEDLVDLITYKHYPKGTLQKFPSRTFFSNFVDAFADSWLFKI